MIKWWWRVSQQGFVQPDQDLPSPVPTHPLSSLSLLLEFHTYSAADHTFHSVNCNYFPLVLTLSQPQSFCFSPIWVLRTASNSCPWGSFTLLRRLILTIRCIFLTNGLFNWRQSVASRVFRWFSFIDPVCAQVTILSWRIKFRSMRRMFLKPKVKETVGLWKRVIGSVGFKAFCLITGLTEGLLWVWRFFFSFLQYHMTDFV